MLHCVTRPSLHYVEIEIARCCIYLQIIVDESSISETSCISREELPVGRVISRQVFSEKRAENTRSYQNDKANPTSCIKGQSTKQNQPSNVERTCPFARISFEARHDVLYTRKCFYRFEPSVQWDGGLVQKSTTLHEYFSRVDKTVDAECVGISRDTRQAVRNYLPELIYLGRSEWYSFVFYLYLDYDFQVGELQRTR